MHPTETLARLSLTKARAATQLSWHVGTAHEEDGHNEPVVRADGGSGDYEICTVHACAPGDTEDIGLPNAHFIAQMDPPTVITLCTDLLRARQALRRIADHPQDAHDVHEMAVEALNGTTPLRRDPNDPAIILARSLASLCCICEKGDAFDSTGEVLYDSGNPCPACQAAVLLQAP